MHKSVVIIFQLEKDRVFVMVKPEHKLWLSGLRRKRRKWSKNKFTSSTHYQQWIWYSCSHSTPAKPTSASKQWSTSKSTKIGVSLSNFLFTIQLYCVLMHPIYTNPINISWTSATDYNCNNEAMVNNCNRLQFHHYPINNLPQWRTKLLEINSYISTTFSRMTFGFGMKCFMKKIFFFKKKKVSCDPFYVNLHNKALYVPTACWLYK